LRHLFFDGFMSEDHATHRRHPSTSRKLNDTPTGCQNGNENFWSSSFPRAMSTSRKKRENKKAGCTPCLKSLIFLVEQRGVEPLTSALRTRRSAKLSYCPTSAPPILGSQNIGVKQRIIRYWPTKPHYRQLALLQFNLEQSTNVETESSARAL
jgi:hypothetical protein